jgi:hypothetical protein
MKRKIVKTQVIDEPHGMTGIFRVVKVDASEFKEGQKVQVTIDALAKELTDRKAMRGKDTDMHGHDTVVQCKKCGRKQYLEFINGMKNGWSKCCGETMLLLKTTADMKQVIHELLSGGWKKI